MVSLFDGTNSEIAVYIAAFLALVIRFARNYFAKKRPVMDGGEAFAVVANGALVVPFFLIMFAPISSALLEETLRTNKLLLFLAGFAALWHVLAEVFKTPK